jgi:hypothetical protein
MKKDGNALNSHLTKTRISIYRFKKMGGNIAKTENK